MHDQEKNETNKFSSFHQWPGLDSWVFQRSVFKPGFWILISRLGIPPSLLGKLVQCSLPTYLFIIWNLIWTKFYKYWYYLLILHLKKISTIILSAEVGAVLFQNMSLIFIFQFSMHVWLRILHCLYSPFLLLHCVYNKIMAKLTDRTRYREILL